MMALAATSPMHSPLADPAFTVLHSSRPLDWNDILVEHVRLRQGDLVIPRLADHLICMTVGGSSPIEQRRYGKAFRHTFEPGQAQVLPVETAGTWRMTTDVELLHLQFSQRFIQSLAQDTMDADPARVELMDQFLIQDPQVTHIGYALFAELREGGMNGRTYSGALASALGTHLLRKYAVTAARSLSRAYDSSRHLLSRAVDYIYAHLADDIDLMTLAAQASLSSSHFNAVFRQQFGVSPYQYILQLRVERARDLLQQGELTIAQVAAEVGFYDQSHLTRHMRRLLHVTPAALQRQRNVQNPRRIVQE
jgi:AraC family transcriptional regulator